MNLTPPYQGVQQTENHISLNSLLVAGSIATNDEMKFKRKWRRRKPSVHFLQFWRQKKESIYQELHIRKCDIYSYQSWNPFGSTHISPARSTFHKPTIKPLESSTNRKNKRKRKVKRNMRKPRMYTRESGIPIGIPIRVVKNSHIQTHNSLNNIHKKQNSKLKEASRWKRERNPIRLRRRRLPKRKCCWPCWYLPTALLNRNCYNDFECIQKHTSSLKNAVQESCGRIQRGSSVKKTTTTTTTMMTEMGSYRKLLKEREMEGEEERWGEVWRLTEGRGAVFIGELRSFTTNPKKNIRAPKRTEPHPFQPILKLLCLIPISLTPL